MPAAAQPYLDGAVHRESDEAENAEHEGNATWDAEPPPDDDDSDE